MLDKGIMKDLAGGPDFVMQITALIERLYDKKVPACLFYLLRVFSPRLVQGDQELPKI